MLSNINETIEFAIDRCERLARKAVRGPQFSHMTADDLAQELLVRVVKAIPAYEPTLGSIEAFLGSVIDDALRELRRRESGPQARARRSVSPAREPTDPASETSDRTPELVAEVQCIVKTAPPEEQELARFVGTANVSAAARALGISRAEARTLLRRLGTRFPKEFFDLFANWSPARRGQK